MGFFSRLKWLFTGKGEAPAGYTATPGATKRHDSAENRSSGNYRNDRNRGPRSGRDRNARRDNRGSREQRGERPNSRQGFNRDESERGRFNRDRSRRGRMQNDGGRRDHRDSDIPRQIIRPTGGPSSTMMPSQSSSAEPVAAAPVSMPQGPEKVGVVSGYMDDARMALIKMEKGMIRSGDWIEIQGHISTLRQKVESLQLGADAIGEAVEGQEVSIKVIRPVKSGDAVIRLRG